MQYLTTQADFGYSAKLTRQEPMRQSQGKKDYINVSFNYTVGTTYWMAPEVISNSKFYDTKVTLSKKEIDKYKG